MTTHKQEHKIKLVYTHKIYELEDFKFLGFGVGFFFFLEPKSSQENITDCCILK